MRYMLLINTDEGALATAAPETVTTMSADYAAYTEAMNKAGINRGGERLQPASRTVRVSVRDGKRRVLDGPYADSKEQLGGYYIIEVPSQQEAIAWAERCPAAAHGTVEVRPIWEMPGM
jgi:hypothetical protein